MKYTEKEFGTKFNVSLDTAENQEAFLRMNATCDYDLSLITMYIKNIGQDHSHRWLNRLRKRGLCN